MSTNKNWIARVIENLKGGDEGKVTRFNKKLKKYYEQQRAMRNSEIENLNEKIEDAKEKLEDIIVSPSLDQLNDSDSAGNYCAVFAANIQKQLNVIQELEEKVETLEEELKQLAVSSSLIFG